MNTEDVKNLRLACLHSDKERNDMSKKIDKYTTKNGKILYKFQIYVGRTKTTGTPVYVRKRGFKCYREAKDTYEEISEQIKKGTYNSKKNKRYKVSDLVKLWLRGYKNTVRNSTYASTLGIMNNHILPDLGAYYLDQLQPAKCIEVVNKWAGLAPKSVKKFMIYTNKILDKGVEWQMIQQNPMKYVDYPKIKSNKLDFTDFYSKQELEKFLEEAEKHHSYKIFTFFRLLGYSGIRRNEALALTWGDIDFTTNTLSINKTLAQGEKNRLIIDDPKSTSGVRDIPLDGQTMGILRQWRSKQREEMFRLGYNTDNEEQLVFSNGSNAFYQPSRVREWNKAVCKSGELRFIKTHGFRHTHATLLLEAGVPMQDIKKRLGHSNISITMDTYAHVTKDRDYRTVGIFEQFMSE